MTASSLNRAPLIKNYIWVGINSQGQRIRGILPGYNFASIKMQLRDLGVEPLKIKQKRFSKITTKVPQAVITAFYHQLAMLLSASIPLTKALDHLIQNQTNTNFQRTLIAIKQDLYCGKTFYESLARFSTLFDSSVINLIKIGEQSGTVTAILAKIAKYSSQKDSFKRSLRKSMYYPVIVSCTCIGIIGALIKLVIPKFEDLFQTFGSSLPLFTRIVINLGKILHTYGIFFIGLLGLILISGYLLKKNKRFSYKIAFLTLHLPIIRTLLPKIMLAKMAHHISITLNAGLPLLDSLKGFVTIISNQVYLKSFYQIIAEVSSGETLHRAMKTSKIMPHLVTQMVATGESTGTLPLVFEKLAELYDQEVKFFLDNFITILEPIIIITLSVLIGAFVLAMYLPIFKMGAIF